MTSNDNPDPAGKQNKQELDDAGSELIEKLQNISLDEDSDDDFDPKRDEEPSIDSANYELWSLR